MIKFLMLASLLIASNGSPLPEPEPVAETQKPQEVAKQVSVVALPAQVPQPAYYQPQAFFYNPYHALARSVQPGPYFPFYAPVPAAPQPFYAPAPVAPQSQGRSSFPSPDMSEAEAMAHLEQAKAAADAEGRLLLIPTTTIGTDGSITFTFTNPLTALSLTLGTTTVTKTTIGVGRR